LASPRFFRLRPRSSFPKPFPNNPKLGHSWPLAWPSGHTPTFARPVFLPLGQVGQARCLARGAPWGIRVMGGIRQFILLSVQGQWLYRQPKLRPPLGQPPVALAQAAAQAPAQAFRKALALILRPMTLPEHMPRPQVHAPGPATFPPPRALARGLALALSPRPPGQGLEEEPRPRGFGFFRSGLPIPGGYILTLCLAVSLAPLGPQAKLPLAKCYDILFNHSMPFPISRSRGRAIQSPGTHEPMPPCRPTPKRSPAL
jgi:hypothetical protein